MCSIHPNLTSPLISLGIESDDKKTDQVGNKETASITAGLCAKLNSSASCLKNAALGLGNLMRLGGATLLLQKIATQCEDNQNKRCVVYGAAAPRQEVLDILKENGADALGIKVEALNSYNTELENPPLGIDPRSISDWKEYCQFIEKLKGLLPGDTNTNPWLDFLKEHTDELDLAQTLKNRIDRGEDREKVLAEFVVKNLDESGLTPLDAERLAAAYDAIRAGHQPREDALATIQALTPYQELNAFLEKSTVPTTDGLPSMAKIFLFRRLSKLGLEFFHKQGIPVIFVRNPVTEDAGKTEDVIGLKPWKDLHCRPISAKAQAASKKAFPIQPTQNHKSKFYPEPITYSEMRSLLREKKPLPPVPRKLIDVVYSPGIFKNTVLLKG